jgi:hypothetical protein
MCGDILASQLGRRFNLADPKELVEYVAAGGPAKCAAVVNNAVRYAAELILDKADETNGRHKGNVDQSGD